MSNMRKYILLVFVIAFMYGCYEKDTVTSELESSIIMPKPSEDPLEQAIYDFYKESNSIICYKYDTLDYRWNFKQRENTYVIQENRDYLLQGVNCINTLLGNYYTKEFKIRNFPPKIFLADSLNILSSDLIYVFKDEISYSRGNHIALGRIREGLSTLSIEDHCEYRAYLNACLWRYMFSNNKLNIPDVYFEIGEALYGNNFLSLEENAGSSYNEVDTKRYGFWNRDLGADERDENGMVKEDNSYCMAPDKSLDIFQFVYHITRYDIQTLQPIFDKYPKLQEKYSIFIEYAKKDFGIDLQEIGNTK